MNKEGRGIKTINFKRRISKGSLRRPRKENLFAISSS
jgi:hypothetical protein